VKAMLLNLLILSIACCGELGVARQSQADEPPRVTIDSGAIEGTLADGIRAFKGIPYAAAPVGELRWRAPQPVQKWTEVRKATKYGHDAPQKLSWDQDEDCLYLNVWAPADAADKPYPVMVWIHGGGFIQGSGRFNGEGLAKQGVVLVSLNYRLGRLGFFAHPALDKSRPAGEPPANFWLQDQVAALKWIQRNIAQFGGDPNRVTIFGVSAGGTSVNLLMASPLAEGLFHRAIAQSGIGGFGPYRRWNVAYGEREPLTSIGERYAKAQGVDSQTDVADALRALPWKTVAAIGTEDREGFDIVVDGVSLTDDPQKVFEQGKQNRVPFIAGFNSFEGNLSLVLPWIDQPPRAEVEKRLVKLAPLYGKQPDDQSVWSDLYGDVFFGASALTLVRGMEQVKTPAWTYYFDYVRGRGRNARGAGHGSESPFILGTVLLPGARDREIIQAMQGYWIQFAKTGDPNVPGLAQWSAYSSVNSTTLVIGQEGIRSERDWLKPRFDLLFEAIAATWSPDGKLLASQSATTNSNAASVAKPGAAEMLDSAQEKALRVRVTALFEALSAGDVEKCLALSDPAVVKEKGRDTAEKFYKGVSGLVKFAKVQAKDRVIKSITPIDDGQAAKVEIELTLNGKKQPPGYEIWGLVEGQWYYRSTVK
jgi:para-nitrobenzyl esterase